MKYIVTHGGKSHLDETIACALAMAQKGEGFLDDLHGVLPIERRDPTPEELDDDAVIVLDVGRRLEPEKSNWDHHQLERGTRACAMSLLAADLTVPNGEPGVDPFDETLRNLFPWFDARTDLDAVGPYKAAEYAGTAWGSVVKFLGPLEEVFLRMFEEAPTAQARGELVYEWLTKPLDAKVAAYAEVIRSFHHEQASRMVDYLDFTEADPDKVELVSDAVTSHMSGGVAIFHSKPRNAGETWESTGLTLLRLKDDPRVDFSKVEGDPEVSFAHKGGFICCTKSKSVEEAVRLIDAATVEP